MVFSAQHDTETEENELRRKAILIFQVDSSWHRFHLINAYIYSAIQMY